MTWFFVKANRALRHRHEESPSMDLILLKDIDESNEWLLGRMDGDSDDDTLVFEDDNLTWATVARASGADEPNYYTRRRTSQGSTTKQGSMSNKDKGKAPASSSWPRGRFQLLMKMKMRMRVRMRMLQSIKRRKRTLEMMMLVDLMMLILNMWRWMMMMTTSS